MSEELKMKKANIGKEFDENGVPVCKICGLSVVRIAAHALNAHGVTSQEYAMLPVWSGKTENAALIRNSELLGDNEIFKDGSRYLKIGIANVFSFGSFGGKNSIVNEYWNEEARSYIPKLDDTFVPNKDILEMLALGVESDIPIYCYGPTGSGKSSVVQYLAAVTGMPLRRINLHGDTRASDLLGVREVVTDENGQSITKFSPGVVTQCMTNGWWLLLDEIDCAKTGIMMVLQAILERSVTGSKKIAIPNYGVIDVHPLFRIFGTGNTNGRGEYMELYPGTQVLNEAFMDRFALSAFVPYDWEVIKNALPKRIKGCDRHIPVYLKVAEEMQRAFESEECRFTLSPRKVFTWAEITSLYEKGGYTPENAINIAAKNVILSKLSSEDKAFFIDAYQRFTKVDLRKS